MKDIQSFLPTNEQNRILNEKNLATEKVIQNQQHD